MSYFSIPPADRDYNLMMDQSNIIPQNLSSAQLHHLHQIHHHQQVLHHQPHGHNNGNGNVVRVISSPLITPPIPMMGPTPGKIPFGHHHPMQHHVVPMHSSMPGNYYNPYMTMTKNNDYTLNQLNISRTIILKHLNKDLSLTALLNEIDFGPIEYLKLFVKETINHDANDKLEQSKVCYISFINSSISINFYLKYNNMINLTNLRTKLNSKYLKINLNDSKNLKDFIKLKTLNYINDFQATRCLEFQFKLLDHDHQNSSIHQDHEINQIANPTIKPHYNCDTKPDDKKDSNEEPTGLTNDTIQQTMKDFLIAQIYKLNLEFEDLKFNGLDKVQIHFNSIDASIKIYEICQKIIQTNHQLLINKELLSDDIVLIACNFHTDRCDRTPLEGNDLPHIIDRRRLSANSNSHSRSMTPLENNQNDIINESVRTTLLNDYTNNTSSNHNSIDSKEDNNHELNSLNENCDYDSDIDPIDPINGDGNVNNHDIHGYVTPNLSRSGLSLSGGLGLHTPGMMTPSGLMTPGMVPGLATPGLGNSSLAMPPQSLAAPNGLPPNGFDDEYLYNYSYNDPYNTGNRSIYLGNLHPNTTVEEIANNVRAGGLLESIKYFPDKRHCFITFIDPVIALKFYLNHQVVHQLIIHGYDINVGWAKTHSGLLNREISLAVTAGASRNVYIGIKLNKNEDPNIEIVKPKLPTDYELRNDFKEFGDLEQINFYHNDSAFLNFCNIFDAIRLVELFELKNSTKLNLIAKNPNFYDKYKIFKVSFGKDRCGNPPKFSFKKKFGKVRQKIYFEDKKPSDINDEAAMVFGIIKDEKPVQHEYEDSKNAEFDSSLESLQESPEESEEVDVKGVISENKSSPNNTEIGFKELKSTINETIQEQHSGELELEKDTTDKNAEEHLEGKENGKDESEEKDDDDDISIIIGSDDTSSTTANNSNEKEKKKFYNNLVNSSDPFIPSLPRSKRNGSNISLGKYKSPYMYQSPSFPHHLPPQANQPSSPYGYPGYQYGPPPPPNSMSYHNYPHGTPPHPHYPMHSQVHNLQSNMQQYHSLNSPSPVPPQLHHSHSSHQLNYNHGYNNYSNYHSYYSSNSNYNLLNYPNNGSQGNIYHGHHQHGHGSLSHLPGNSNGGSMKGSFSGSSVMAQYLAKSHNDNLFYQSNVIYDDKRKKSSH